MTIVERYAEPIRSDLIWIPELRIYKPIASEPDRVMVPYFCKVCFAKAGIMIKKEAADYEAVNAMEADHDTWKKPDCEGDFLNETLAFGPLSEHILITNQTH